MDPNHKMLLAGLIAFLAICTVLYFQKQGINLAIVSPTPNPLVLSTKINAVNSPGESGTATITESAGQITVTLDITGAPAGLSQIVSIQSGSCPNLRDFKYPLSDLVAGKSVTTLGLKLADLKAKFPLSIAIHPSIHELNNTLACGTFTP